MTVGVDLISIPLTDVPDKDIVVVYPKIIDELIYIPSTRYPRSCILYLPSLSLGT
jgi:hypothetical protein